MLCSTLCCCGISVWMASHEMSLVPDTELTLHPRGSKRGAASSPPAPARPTRRREAHRCASGWPCEAQCAPAPGQLQCAGSCRRTRDDFEDEEPVSSPPPAFETRPPPGQSPPGAAECSTAAGRYAQPARDAQDRCEIHYRWSEQTDLLFSSVSHLMYIFRLRTVSLLSMVSLVRAT